MQLDPKNIIDFDELGTHWECEILDNNTSNKILADISQDVIRRAKDFSCQYSRFDEKSLVSQLNRQYYLDSPPSELLAMLRYAKKMFHTSHGIFNISAGGVLSAKGYGPSKYSNNINNDFWSQTKMSKAKLIIAQNSTIDFGGFGKGWLIDELARMLRAKGIKEFIVNGGGDLYVESNKPIKIMLEHPTNPHMSIGQTFITKGALAVSSTIKRSWQQDGKNQHHIIDPETGDSANSSAVSTFVRASNALIADTMATILLIEPGLEQELSKKYQLKTIIIDKSQIKL